MDYFLEAFGGITVERAAVVIAAVAFLVAGYIKHARYLRNRALADKEKDDRLQEVIDQTRKYPEWHRQSIEIQKKFTELIDELKEGQQEHQRKLEEIEQDNRRRERNKLRDRLLQSYRYFTSTEKNPLQAWSEMEADAFWNIFQDYEDAGGDGHVHTEVEPAMRKLEVVPMHEEEKIAALMNSRK